MSRRLNDLTGQRFGRLVVLERAENHAVITRDSNGCIKHTNNYPMWKCKCDCGNTVITYGHHLVAGNTKSCGCYRNELASARLLARLNNGTA